MSGRPFCIGLGGLIASGKSSLAAVLVANDELQKAFGGAIEHLDADALLRTARSTDEALRKAIADVVPGARGADGALNTTILAAEAFADPAAMSRLEELQWPVVRAAIRSSIRTARERGVRLVLVEAIALGRSGLAQELDGAIFLQVDEAVRRERFVARGGSATDFDLRNAAQSAIPAEMKEIGAVTIDGNGSLLATVQAASKALRRLCLQGESID